MSNRNWNRSAHHGKRTLSTYAEVEHRGRDAAARWLAENDKPAQSKEGSAQGGGSATGGHAGTLEWCTGHAGIVGNERADALSLVGRERASEERAALADGASATHLIEQQLRYEVI